MVEIAEELVKTVHGRQRLIAIADVILAELTRGIAEIFEQPADRRIQLAHAHGRTGKAYLGQSGANAMLTSEKRRASRGTRLLPVVMLELDALTTDTIDARRLVAHQPVRVGADVGDADVVTPDDQDVGFAAGRRGRRRSWSRRGWRGFLGLCQGTGSQGCG